MPHRNAPLTETGRLRLARCVVDDGWPLRRAAERFQVSVTTAKRWADRYRQSGQAVVTLTDALTGRRKDLLLGRYDTEGSRAEYKRVIGEWEANGRRLPDAPVSLCKAGICLFPRCSV